VLWKQVKSRSPQEGCASHSPLCHPGAILCEASERDTCIPLIEFQLGD
jgi:hypothetical protein